MRRRNLLALGVNPKRVHMASRSRKGYWRMSEVEIVGYALNNRWLEEQGVPDRMDGAQRSQSRTQGGLGPGS